MKSNDQIIFLNTYRFCQLIFGFDTYKYNECNLIFIALQSYFMGCSFDNFSTSWWDRSYVITLLILAWFIPLVIIFISHIGILYRVRHSNIKDLLIKKFSYGCSTEANTCGQKLELRRNTSCRTSISTEKSSLPHMLQRVS